MRQNTFTDQYVLVDLSGIMVARPRLQLVVLFLASRWCLVLPAGRLGTYNVDDAKISMSGLSSGAFFTVQFHVAFSRTIMGVGAIAGGPYYCARNSFWNTVSTCSILPNLIDVPGLIAFTRETERNGTIDPVDGMKGDKVIIVRGVIDSFVKLGVAEKLFDYYREFVDESDIERDFDHIAEHAVCTEDYGNRWNYLGKPFINKCNYSTAQEILQHIYGDIIPATSSMAHLENLMEFDQSEFFGPMGSKVGMNKIAFVYVPTACQNKYRVCRLHVALHGCWMSRGVIGRTFVEHGGYNQLGEVNNIIILYPQTRRSLSPLNPTSCWDWWGYTSPNYANQQGPQMAAVKTMIDRLKGSG